VTRLLVDTHALLWWLVDDPLLPRAAREAIADPVNTPLVSAASVWEVAIKRSLGKLHAPDDLPARIVGEGFDWLPVNADHAWHVRNLPPHHRDPFDRLLVAQAIVDGLPVVTGDPHFGAYGVATRW
jgi:PIN domain nuclease of toxin-antitoxin system